MARVKLLICLSVLVHCSASLECPASSSQLEDSENPLSDARLNLYLDEADFQGALPGRVDLISSNRVALPFNSLDFLRLFSSSLPSIPANLTSAIVRLELETGEREVYVAVSVLSLDAGLAPPGCAQPSLQSIAPGENTSIQVGLPCSGDGLVFMQLCLTIGTEPFHLLNGTYETFTVFFPRTCEGQMAVDGCNLKPPTDIVPVNLCVTVNETIRLVNYGAGGWSFLLGIFSSDSQSDSERGYCFIDSRGMDGLSPIISDDETNRNFYIPLAFPDLDIYIERTGNDEDAAVMYAASFTSEDDTVLSDPVADYPQRGILPQERLHVSIAMPCKAAGFVRVNLSFNATFLKDNILYRRDFNIYYYRNCTSDVIHRPRFRSASERLGVLVGVPIAVLVVIVAVLVGVVTAVLVHLTRKQKRRGYELEVQLELSKLPTSNAYISTFINPFAFLEGYDIEYNFVSLEIIEELGQGAFGRVFKARAPGLTRGEFTPREFVAVKTLKEEAEADILEDFSKEVKVCVQFEHVNIIRLIGVCTTSVKKCMIFEYMDLGNLGDLLRLSNPENPANPGPDSGKKLITPDLFLSISLQVANGLVYLAQLKFVHRDIAARNCLVDSEFTVKIADFGMSREVSSSDYYRIGSRKACLPVRWLPPEALLYGKFTLKSDVWSFGVLMWEVYSLGRQPHGGLSNYEVIDRIKEGRLLECPAHCPASVFDIMKSCWFRAPAKRAAMTTIFSRLNHLHQAIATRRTSDNYITMTSTEGYLNLSYGETVSEKELEDSREVEEVLKKRRERELADIEELLGESEDEEDEKEIEEKGETEKSGP